MSFIFPTAFAPTARNGNVQANSGTVAAKHVRAKKLTSDVVVTESLVDTAGASLITTPTLTSVLEENDDAGGNDVTNVGALTFDDSVGVNIGVEGDSISVGAFSCVAIGSSASALGTETVAIGYNVSSGASGSNVCYWHEFVNYHD